MSLKQVQAILSDGEKLLAAAGASDAARQLATVQALLKSAKGGLEARVGAIEALAERSRRESAASKQVLTALVRYTTTCRPRKQGGVAVETIIARLIEAVADDPWLSSAPAADCVAKLRAATGREKPMTDASDTGATIDHDAIARDFRERARSMESIKHEIDVLFSRSGLNASDEKQIAAKITKAPARVLNTRKARREAIEQWFYGRIREEDRARRHVDVINKL